MGPCISNIFPCLTHFGQKLDLGPCFIQVFNCGVPQGSVLGPLLFPIYINDIVNSSNLFRFSLFADDTVATLSGKNLQTLVSSVNREISNVSLWFKVNKLSLNLSKTNYIIFRTRKRRVPTHLPELLIDDAIINKVDNVKFLGLTIIEYLDWSTHISVISKSVARSVGILSKLKFILPSNILKLIYNSLILPHLNYCNHIWGNTFKSHLKQLHILQKKSERIITKSSFYSASAPLLKSLLILPIYDLVTLNTLIFKEYTIKYSKEKHDKKNQTFKHLQDEYEKISQETEENTSEENVEKLKKLR